MTSTKMTSTNRIVANAIAARTARNVSLKEGQSYRDAAKPLVSQLARIFDEIQELAYEAHIDGDSRRKAYLLGAAGDIDKVAGKLQRL